jgi:hypothetical protein
MPITVNKNKREEAIQKEYDRILANIKASAENGKDTFNETIETFDATASWDIIDKLEREEGVKVSHRGKEFIRYSPIGMVWNVRFFVD